MDEKKLPSVTIRCAKKEELEIVTDLGVSEDWHLSPQDLVCAYDLDPTGFLIGDLDGEIVSHINCIKYPGHSSFIGTFLVTKENRGKGYGRLTAEAAFRYADQSHTIGCETLPHLLCMYEECGMQWVWNTSIATIDLEKTVKALAHVSLPSLSVSFKSIQAIDFEMLLKYDTSVFGISRQKLLQSYIKVPGTFGWAAVNAEGQVIGYNVVKQVITGGGTDIGLAMAPLYADDEDTARMLIKVAVEGYLATTAVPKAHFELTYSYGGSFGDHSLQLMRELGAKPYFDTQRMYTKGIPPGRQIHKMYGILSIEFD